eukprot:c44971_g1_i1 orf=213-452(-)
MMVSLVVLHHGHKPAISFQCISLSPVTIAPDIILQFQRFSLGNGVPFHTLKYLLSHHFHDSLLFHLEFNSSCHMKLFVF